MVAFRLEGLAGRSPARGSRRNQVFMSADHFSFSGLSRRHGGGVVATAVLCRLGAAREWRESSQIERPRVGAARRADQRLRRESAESHKPNPPAEPPGRRSQRSSPPHPQTAHASSPRGRRAGARPKRDWASDWRAMEEQRSCSGVEGFLELAHGSHDFVEVRNIAEKHGAEHGLVVRAPIWQLLCGR